jgi:hypothetical protein
MMARKPSALAGIFDDEPETTTIAPVADPVPCEPAAPRRLRRAVDTPAPAATTKRSSHPGKKPVLTHIPEDMHRALRQLSVEEGGEPLTVITERLLRQYLVKRGHTRFAP